MSQIVEPWSCSAIGKAFMPHTDPNSAIFLLRQIHDSAKEGQQEYSVADGLAISG